MGWKDSETRRAYNKAYNAANREQIRAQRKAYREANAEEIKARKRADYLANRARLMAKQSAYNAAHREEQKMYQRERYATKREECLASNRASRQKHHEKRLAGYRKYYQEHREECIAKSKEYSTNHLEERLAYRMAYYARTREKVLAQKKQEYWANPTLARIKTNLYRTRRDPKKIKITNDAWRKRNPEKTQVYKSRRRARRINAAINDFTPEQWRSLQIIFKHRCAYCGQYAKGKLTQDHITPLAKGGNHTLSNIVPACQPCNSKKFTGPPLAPVQPLLL